MLTLQSYKHHIFHWLPLCMQALQIEEFNLSNTFIIRMMQWDPWANRFHYPCKLFFFLLLQLSTLNYSTTCHVYPKFHNLSNSTFDLRIISDIHPPKLESKLVMYNIANQGRWQVKLRGFKWTPRACKKKKELCIIILK